MKNAILLAAITALSLSACGKHEGTTPQTPAAPAAPAASAPAAPAASAPAAPAPSAAAPVASATPAGNAGETEFKTVCSTCHGAQAQGMGSFPKLAGMTAADLKAKLEKYRKGETIGPMSSTMIPQAKALTDKQIDEVSAYIATLK